MSYNFFQLHIIFLVFSFFEQVTSKQLTCYLLDFSKTNHAANIKPAYVKEIWWQGDVCLQEDCLKQESIKFINHSSYFSSDDTKIKITLLWKIILPKNYKKLCGFMLNFAPITINKPTNCYTLPNNTMTSSQNQFYLQCSFNVIPNTKYYVPIVYADSKPTQLEFTVPDCSYKNFSLATTCPNIQVNISNDINCSSRTFEISYAMSSSKCNNGKCDALIRLVTTKPYGYTGVSSSFIIPSMFGKLNISLPMTEPLDETYFVEISYQIRSKMPGKRKYYNVTQLFDSCIKKKIAPISVFPAYVVFVVCTISLCLLGIGSLIYKKRYNLGVVLKGLQRRNPVPVSESLFLLFVNDHKMHQNTVLKFAAFLHCDLGYRVRFELFERERVLADPRAWMEQCFSEAHKVLFIWSPGATERWNLSERNLVQSDTFTPILRKAFNEQSCSKKRGRHFILNFDYCREDDIPENIKSTFHYQFSLMKNFQKFYAKLKGISNTSGNRICGNRFNDLQHYDVRESDYGSVFFDDLSEMQKYTKHAPHWFNEAKTEEKIPSPFNNSPILEAKNSEIFSSKLQIIPPEPF